jgi:hypothetical protein
MATAQNIPSAPIVAFGRPDSLRIADLAKAAGTRDHNGTDRVIAMTDQIYEGGKDDATHAGAAARDSPMIHTGAVPLALAELL